MKLPKAIYLIFFLFILLIILLFVQLSKGNQQSTQVPASKPPQQLMITGTSLTGQAVGVTEFVKVFFSKPVSLEQLQITITPSTEVIYSLDPTAKIVIIAPKNAWNFASSYTVSVSQASRSKDGQSLDRDYEFTFITINRGGI